jgi:hypothetical protein
MMIRKLVLKMLAKKQAKMLPNNRFLPKVINLLLRKGRLLIREESARTMGINTTPTIRTGKDLGERTSNKRRRSSPFLTHLARARRLIEATTSSAHSKFLTESQL